MFKCDKLKATNVSVGVYHKKKPRKWIGDQEEIFKAKENQI